MASKNLYTIRVLYQVSCYLEISDLPNDFAAEYSLLKRKTVLSGLFEKYEYLEQSPS